MAMASLSKTFSESRTRIIGWSVARSVLADDISLTLVKILPERKLWKCLQRSKTWSALIFDDQLTFPSFCPFVQCVSWTFCNPSYEQRFQFNQHNSFRMMIFSSQFIEGNNEMNGSWISQGQCQHSWEKPTKSFCLFGPIVFLLRIQLKLNTALLYTVRPSVRVSVTGVTSHISHIYKGINAMLNIRGPIKPCIFWIKIILAIFLAKTRPDKAIFSDLTNLTIDFDFELSKI